MELNNARLVADGLAFPEGPVIMRNGDLVFVEVMGGRVSRVAPGEPPRLVAEVGGGPNGAAIGPDGALYVCNNGAAGARLAQPASIQRLDLGTGSFDTLYTEADGIALQGPNDLVFDASGGFWFTDYAGHAVLYARPDGSSVKRVVDEVHNPNGIGLSPDQQTLYWSETHTRQVHRRVLAAPGEVVPARSVNFKNLYLEGEVDWSTLVAGLPGAQELDSLAIDAAGNICVGTLVAGGVTSISPDGQAIVKYTLPGDFYDHGTTNMCFGGDDMRTAYITLSHSGRIVSCRWPVPGLKLNFNA